MDALLDIVALLGLAFDSIDDMVGGIADFVLGFGALSNMSS